MAAEFVWNDAQAAHLLDDPAGPVGRDLHRRGTAAESAAKALCPTETGQLRESIMAEPVAVDTEGMHQDVGAHADHALAVELGSRPHRIYPRSADGALVFWWPKVGATTVVPAGGGQHTGRQADGSFKIGKGYVDHPGTHAQPYLRPAIDAARD